MTEKIFKDKKSLLTINVIVILLIVCFVVGGYLIFNVYSHDEGDGGDDPIIITPNPYDGSRIQVALLLDTSNSMDGLIDQAKAKLWEIVNVVDLLRYQGEDPRLEIALYEYGNDGLSSESGYIRLVAPFTTDLDLISEKLFSLTTNGGSEYCGEVIDTSLDQLGWTVLETDLKLIFIAGNEPFDQGEVPYKEAVAKSVAKDVIVNTIHCGDYDEGVQGYWQDGANRGHGKYMNIDHNQEIMVIETPFDEEILSYNQQLNDTYVYYGSEGYDKKIRQEEQDANASTFKNLVSRVVTKSSSKYQNEEWDLIDASEYEGFDWESVDEGSLPEELQGKTEEEKQAYLDEKKSEREDIQNKINDLEKQRQSYLDEQRQQMTAEGQEESLDTAVIQIIKELAMVNNYEFAE